MNDEAIKKRFNEIINEGSLEKKDALTTLKFLIEHVANSDTMRDNVQAVLADTLAEHQTQMKVFIIAYTKARIARVGKLLDALEKIEDKMYEKLATNGEIDERILLTLHASITGSLRGIFELANVCKNLDIPNPAINQFIQNNNTLTIDGMSNKDSRMDLRSNLSKLFKSIEKQNAD